MPQVLPACDRFASRRLTNLIVALMLIVAGAAAHSAEPTSARSFFIDCSSAVRGDGSSENPWDSLADAGARAFAPGDRIALRRGTTCNGSFSPKGSGEEGRPIRLTAYGAGTRPKILASEKDRQALLLFNQQYWQVDSLDLSGSSDYGVFVTGDTGTLHHIALKNLLVHDVRGGAMKSKDNGLVVVGPSSIHVFFEDVLVDGVIAAHTSQWAGILIGGGNFPYKDDAPLNTYVVVRNSSVQDVFGDGIILFRDRDGVIETSTALQTGMQPTQTIGTPNAIWTWTCTDCVVRDNEAFLTDSPGVDGGAYDIDWDNTRNTIERNYAHDTEGYCLAVFAAGYVTRQSVVRDNLCVNNGVSPRLAALQGAIYLSTWNEGVIDGLRMENNTIEWSPPVATAPAIVDDAATRGGPIAFDSNRIVTASPQIYRANAQFAPAQNTYIYSGAGQARFTLGDKKSASLATLQAAGAENESRLMRTSAQEHLYASLRLEANIDFDLDPDGLLAPDPRAQLMVLRSLAMQYGPAALAVTVHLHSGRQSSSDQAAQANALLDLDAGAIRFVRDGAPGREIRLFTAEGKLLHAWRGFQNSAALGKEIRAMLGAPHYPFIEPEKAR